MADRLHAGTAHVTTAVSGGPAGSHFEAQVAAHYLLSNLVGAEPRGLPSTSMDRAELQRTGEERPLDDYVIWHQTVSLNTEWHGPRKVGWKSADLSVSRRHSQSYSASRFYSFAIQRHLGRY